MRTCSLWQPSSLSGCLLPYGQLLRLQQSKSVNKETVSHKRGGRASHWHQQNPWTGLGGGICKCAWRIFPGPLDRWKHFARKTNKTAEWLESHSDEMTPVIVEKRNALAASKACHSKRNLRALRAACRKVWQTTRRFAKDYRLQPCSQIRSVAVAGNINKEENSPSEVRHRRLRWNTRCNATQRYLQKKHWTPSNALLCWRSLTVIQPLNS